MEESFAINVSGPRRSENASAGLESTSISDSLVGMSKEEMKQHLNLCMKLAAENKINVKNAFGLHLIGIMRHLIKHETPDLQFASLSLQASTKIYAGRVEALYKDTCQFHSQLQTMMSHGKKGAANAHHENDDDDDLPSEETRRKTQKSKCKSHITSEESIDTQTHSESTALSRPHDNFMSIKSAFCASRTAQKLLQCLQVKSDLCDLGCGTAMKIYRAKEETEEKISHLPEKVTCHFEKLKDVNVSAELTTIGSASDVFLLPNRNNSRASVNGNDLPDDSFLTCHDGGGGGDSPIFPANDSVNNIIDRFNVLDITANDFANDIAHAVTSGNTINRLLLPPKSALKKVLGERRNSGLDSSLPKPVRKEKAPKGPFFESDRKIESSMFKASGRRNELSDAALGDWHIKGITDICNAYHAFSTTLGHHYGDDKEEVERKEQESLELVLNITQERDDYFSLKNYFHKKPHVRKNIQDHSPILRPSSFGMPLRNDERTGSIFAGDAENLVQSLQNLSLHNSFDCDVGDAFSPCHDPDDEALSPVRNTPLWDEETRLLMVPAPELVKPLSMKFSKKPMSVNTDKFKQALWNAVSSRLEQNDTVLLSDVYKDIKDKFSSDKSSGISLQMTFVMLLILSNEKVLLLENFEDQSDLFIKKDICEIDTSEVF